MWSTSEKPPTRIGAGPEEEVSLPLLPLEIVVYFFSVLLLQVLEKVSLQVLLRWRLWSTSEKPPTRIGAGPGGGGGVTALAAAGGGVTALLPLEIVVYLKSRQQG
ncbi:MAG: hypothetical protein H6925_01270 [Holosporaceae bacterium]|nr:MAG: hypothetical protein H6925_01270 [Holosporaceae bacterium]